MEGSSQNPPPPAGWYVDPDDAALQRFWDGSRWTSSRMPRNEAVPLEGTEEEPAPEPAFRYASDARETTDAGTEAPGGSPPAAWYQDPENPGGMRYWDGSAWTEHRTDYVAEQKKPVGEGMVAAGYITAFMLPVVGVVIGVILMSRENRHGRWVLGLSVAFMVAFFAIGLATSPEET